MNMNSPKEIQPQPEGLKLPDHVCIIMDGNGRWALKHGLERNDGHRMGAEAVRQVTEFAAETGIRYLSLFAFSEENWGRPEEEIEALMRLIVEYVESETPNLMKNNIRVLFKGDLPHLSSRVRERLEQCMRTTEGNTGMVLLIFVNYSGKWDILQAVTKLMETGPDSRVPVSYDTFARYLSTAGIPDPDLMIRTSGEERISNFMLWQIAYTEFYFTPVLWPDFRKTDFRAALEAYSNRKRRFGKIEE